MFYTLLGSLTQLVVSEIIPRFNAYLLLSASLPTQTGLLLVVIERIVTAIDLLNFTSKEMSIFLPLSFLKADMAICLNCCL